MVINIAKVIQSALIVVAGQLGVGTLTNSSVPLLAINVTGAISVAAGAGHTCGTFTFRAIVLCFNRLQQSSSVTATSSAQDVRLFLETLFVF